MITKVARVAAWLLVLAAIVLTLGPQKVRPSTGIDHDLEHGVAFALVGLGYPNHRMILAVLAIAGAGMMEILQQETMFRQLQEEGAPDAIWDFTVKSVASWLP